MSKPYNTYSKQFNNWSIKTSPPNEITPPQEPETLFTPLTDPSAAFSAETPKAPEVIYGIVVKCKALNVREEADITSDKICVVPAGTKVVIDNLDSAREWYSITTEAGLSGYCLSEFISIDK